MSKEAWQTIEGYVGYYQASVRGRVRSLDRIVKHPQGLMKLQGKILKLIPDKKSGYFRVNLSKDGMMSVVCVHRLVLESFIGPCPEGMECCHDDGNPANNRLNNLRWDTRSNNHLDKRRHGTSFQGVKSPNAKLTKKQVLEIIGRLKSGETQTSISKIYGVDRTVIGGIDRGERWKHIKR